MFATFGPKVFETPGYGLYGLYLRYWKLVSKVPDKRKVTDSVKLTHLLLGVSINDWVTIVHAKHVQIHTSEF